MLYAEDDYDLYLAPRIAEYSPEKGGTSRHLMVNGTPDRMAIKVKCSNNEMYRVSPVYTCLDPGCSQRLQVIRDPGEPKLDKIVILYRKTTCKNAIEAFMPTNEESSEIKRALIALIAMKKKKTSVGKEDSPPEGELEEQKDPDDVNVSDDDKPPDTAQIGPKRVSVIFQNRLKLIDKKPSVKKVK